MKRIILIIFISLLVTIGGITVYVVVIEELWRAPLRFITNTPTTESDYYK